MKISTKARYSLRLMIDIAQNQAGGPVPLADVARRQSISTKYLEQLAKALSQAGCLDGVRGAQGGYRLARPADQISAGELVRAAEGDFTPVNCLSDDQIDCPLQLDCPTSRFWGGLRQVMDGYMDAVSLADLARPSEPVALLGTTANGLAHAACVTVKPSAPQAPQAAHAAQAAHVVGQLTAENAGSTKSAGN
ncbi:MAG: RrF2 family transcriptional regulator [Coriobacteriia bacterium]|nr:RrF2 family transcriptional regulator [Coriobacteriia bacterium]